MKKKDLEEIVLLLPVFGVAIYFAREHWGAWAQLPFLTVLYYLIITKRQAFFKRDDSEANNQMSRSKN
jgi:hypothetical protein